jgi:hypothetical protein
MRMSLNHKTLRQSKKREGRKMELSLRAFSLLASLGGVVALAIIGREPGVAFVTAAAVTIAGILAAIYTARKYG